MKRQIAGVFLILFLIPIMAYGQRFTDVRAGLHLGYNSYQMGDFKYLESGIVSDLQNLVPLKQLQNYPMRGSLGASINFIHRGLENGIKYMFHSSGSRHHYGDYSGEIGLDAIMTSNAISGETSYGLNSSAKVWRMFLGLAATNHFGTYRLEDFLVLEQSMTKNSNKLRFHTFSIEPFIKIHREFGQHIALFKIGYDFHFFSSVNHNEGPVFISSNNKAKAEITGFRAEIGYQIRIDDWLK